MERPWLEHYDEGVPDALDCPSIPLGELLEDSAEKHPQHPAVIFGAMVGSRLMDATLTFKELDDAVDSFAAGLQVLGVTTGDRVAIMLPNCPQFAIAAYATWRIGGIVVCCNPMYVGDEVEHLLNDSGAKTIIVLSSFYDRVKAIRSSTKLEKVIVTSIKEYFPMLLRIMFTFAKEKSEGHWVDISGDPDTYWFQKVMYESARLPAPVRVNPKSVSTLIYTGGTTGGPKGAQLTHGNLVSNALALNVWAQTQEAQDVAIAAMPLFHCYGLTACLNACVANGLTCVYIPDPRDLTHVLKSIETHRVTVYAGIPTMFIGFLNLPDRDQYDLASLRFAVSAAAPLPPEVEDQFKAVTGGKMLEAYGLTETSPCATMDPVDRPKVHSIGIPLPNTDVRIVDVETGSQELTTGEIGEIIIKGPQVMKGYWRLPTETDNALRVGPDGQPGWFFSGDIGYMDDEGYFHIADRKKDMIISSGYNVYPAEVEALLFEHPKVREAAVVGAPDSYRGETVKAFIVLKDGETATEDEIIEFCRQRQAAYRIPRIIEFRDELPKSAVGKILRRELRTEDAVE